MGERDPEGGGERSGQRLTRWPLRSEVNQVTTQVRLYVNQVTTQVRVYVNQVTPQVRVLAGDFSGQRLTRWPCRSECYQVTTQVRVYVNQVTPQVRVLPGDPSGLRLTRRPLRSEVNLWPLSPGQTCWWVLRGPTPRRTALWWSEGRCTAVPGTLRPASSSNSTTQVPHHPKHPHLTHHTTLNTPTWRTTPPYCFKHPHL